MEAYQPLGYTPESVRDACAYIKTEAYICLESIEETMSIARKASEVLFQGLDSKVSGWRDHFADVSTAPDEYERAVYARVAHTKTSADPENLGRACELIPEYAKVIPLRAATLEYMQSHDASFHFQLLERMHALLAEKHPEAFVENADLGIQVAEDLSAADPEFGAWHRPMFLMLYEATFFSGVTWPANVGDMLPLYEMQKKSRANRLS